MIPESLQQDPVAAAVAAKFPSGVLGGHADLGELTLDIDPAQIVEVCTYLKSTEKFVRLSGLTAVDWLPQEPRFEIIYLLHSVERNLRLRLRSRVGGEKPEIDSVYGVWRGCDWYEREVFDLYGVNFRNHPDMRRLMMPDNWKGHPLRKDYPVHGYKYSYADEK